MPSETAMRIELPPSKEARAPKHKGGRESSSEGIPSPRHCPAPHLNMSAEKTEGEKERSEFDHDGEKEQTFADCSKKGQMVFLLRRGDKKHTGGILGQHSHSVSCPWSKPFWTLEPIQKGEPILIVDAEGSMRVVDYTHITTNWSFAKDYCYGEEHTLKLGVGFSRSEQMKFFNEGSIEGMRYLWN